MRSNSGMSGVISSKESYAERSAGIASPPMKCSMRSMPMWMASRGLTELRKPEPRWPVTERPW